MCTGIIHLDYEGESQFKLEVTRFVRRDNELSFDFKGVDDGARYEGSSQLTRSGGAFKGDARYKYDGESEDHVARVVLTLQGNDDEFSASGTWTEDNEAYDLDGDFSCAGS